MQQAIQPHSICISMLLDIPLILLLRLKSSIDSFGKLYRVSVAESFVRSRFSLSLWSRVCLARKMFAWKSCGAGSGKNKGGNSLLPGIQKNRRHCFNFKQRKRLYIFAIGGRWELKNKGRKIAKVRR